MHQLHVPAADGEPSDEALEALMVVSVALSTSERTIFGIGAGVSTNAGIPDFRSSSRGIYSSSLNKSQTRPVPLFAPPASTSTSIKDLFSYSSLIDPRTRSCHLQFMASLHRACRDLPRLHASSHVAPSDPPTVFHALLKRLNDVERNLLRIYSQNVDGFEARAGLGSVNLEKTRASPAGSSSRHDDPEKEDDSASDYEQSANRPHQRPAKRRRPNQRTRTVVDIDCWSALPRTDKVVAMHGSLDSVVCAACGWTEDWDVETTERFSQGKSVDCPRCRERCNLRLSASKRRVAPSSLSFLRPNLVLYDDPSSVAHSTHLSSLSALVAHDVEVGKPDCLVVAGTSLQIPGFKSVVKAFAHEVKGNGGMCVLVNREALATTWNEVFDYEFRMDTDDFAARVLSNLDALVQIPPLSPTSPSATPRTSSPSLAKDDHAQQTPPRPYDSRPPLCAMIQLPTPSPTPSSCSILTGHQAPPSSSSSSSGFFAPSLSKTRAKMPGTVATEDDGVQRGLLSLLPSPPPTSSPIRSSSSTFVHRPSRQRAAEAASLSEVDRSWAGGTEERHGTLLEEENESRARDCQTRDHKGCGVLTRGSGGADDEDQEEQEDQEEKDARLRWSTGREEAMRRSLVDTLMLEAEKIWEHGLL